MSESEIKALKSIPDRVLDSAIKHLDEAREDLVALRRSPVAPRQRAVAGTSVVCEACGCRWKRHADGWLQLYDAEQKPCAKCDNAPNPPLRAETMGDSAPVAPSGEASGDRAVADRLTAAVREADSAFEKSGGSSRHWVRDCLLPILDKHGLSLVPTSDDVKCEACGSPSTCVDGDGMLVLQLNLET